MEEIIMQEKVLTKTKFTTRQIAVVGMLFAITIVLGATGIGFIPIPPFKLTIMHLPVIIGSLIEGPIIGGLLGLLFGLFSMFQAINTPSPVSFIFMNPLVAVLPRILIGVTPYLAYKYINIKKFKLKLAISAAIGSFTNTIGVVGVIYALYLKAYAEALHISIGAASKSLFILIINGFNSAALAIFVTVPIVLAVNRTRK
jgi:uncharacterized membrane protein